MGRLNNKGHKGRTQRSQRRKPLGNFQTDLLPKAEAVVHFEFSPLAKCRALNVIATFVSPMKSPILVSKTIQPSTTRRIVGNARARRSKMIAFGWYGGKFSHLDFILPNLPNGERHFCDVFGGSAAVLINRNPPRSKPIMI